MTLEGILWEEWDATESVGINPTKMGRVCHGREDCHSRKKLKGYEGVRLDSV